MAWDLSCPDWWERIQAGRAPIPDLPLWSAPAERAARIFGKLRLADVPGTPTTEEAGGEWFADVVRSMFGSVDPVTGNREVRELFGLVPKKNAKTTFGALGMITAMLMNTRPRATFLLTAPVQDVTQLAYDAAAGAIELDPVLKKKFHPRDHLKKIIHRETGAQLEIMTFDPRVMTGIKVSGGALIDELHECAKMTKAAKALRQIRGGMVPYPEAFLWFITTQSDGQPVGVFADELQKARDIRDGKRLGKMLPVMFEFPKAIQESQDKDWEKPELWPLLNPNIGRAMTLDRMSEEYQDAKQTSEAELQSWASQHLNIQIGVALHSGRWAGAEYWEARRKPRITLKHILAVCDAVVVGIDGGGLDDLAGLAVLGRHRHSRKKLLWSHAYAHRKALQRRKGETERYADFEKDGDLTVVDSDGEGSRDLKLLAATVKKVQDSGKLVAIGMDQAGLGPIPDELEEAGVDKELFVGIPQGFKMGSTSKTAERWLMDGMLEHHSSRLMDWCVGNAKVEAFRNAIYITKAASGVGKIDPLMAALNAIELMSRNPQAAPDLSEFFSSPVIG